MKKYGTYFAFMCMIFALALLIFFLRDRTSPGDVLDFPPDENIFLGCETGKDRALRYNCYKDAALSSIEQGGTIDKLFGDVVNGPWRNFHLKQHAIGRAALIASGYNLQSLEEKCEPNCVFGYYHGITEEWGKYAPSNVDRYEKFLSSFCDLEGPKRSECYHHLGHLYFYASGSKHFKGGMEICNDIEGDESFFWCSYGVLHQSFSEREYKNFDGFFELCPNYTDRIKKACYMHGSFLYTRWSDDRDPANLLALCEELDGVVPDALNHCYDSTAKRLARTENPPDPAWCLSVKDELRGLCKKSLSPVREVTDFTPASFFDYKFPDFSKLCSSVRGEVFPSGSRKCKLPNGDIAEAAYFLNL